MPQAAVSTIGNFLLAVFGGTSAAATAAAFFAAKVFVYASAQYLLNRAAKALAPKPKANAGLGSGTEVNYYDSEAAVRIVYGQVKTGGMETIPPFTTSKPNSNAFEDLHKVLTLAGHEIDSYNFCHFDTTTITNGQIGAMAFTMSDGLVSSGNFGDHAFIRRYRGTSTDSADRILCSISSPMFGNARARGIAKVAMTFRYSDKVYKSLPTVTFTYQGKRTYDPRLDSSPGADPTNASFKSWNRCPALALADYLMSDLGGSYASTDIDWDTVVTAANYCDALVNIPGAATQARYTCNGVLFATDEFTDNVKMLVDAMLGRVIFRDGKWRMFAGSWQTPTFTVQKEDWISGLSIRFEQGKRKRFNRMRTWFVDPDREWQKVESFPRVNTTYKTADGEEAIDASTEQLMCTSEYEAQRKGEFLLRQSRNQIIVTGRLPPRFQNVALWDTGTIVFDHLGWSSKTFRAVGIDMNPDGSMDCVFAEEQSGDWTDLDAADYFAPSTAAIPSTNVTRPTEPSSFSVAPQLNGTLLFTMGTPIVRPAGTEFQIIRSTNSGDASVGTVVWQGPVSPVPLVMPTSRHWYYARCVTNSAVSPYTPNTFGTLGEPLGEADNTDFRTLIADPEVRLSSVNARFWGYERTDCFSLSLTGGIVDGRVISTATSNEPNDLMIVSMPNSQYVRNITGRAIRFTCHWRTLTAIASRGFGYVHYFHARGWSGVGTPCVSNSNMIDTGVGALLVVNSPATGSVIAQNAWQSTSVVASLGLINTTSYPYIVGVLRVQGAGSLAAGWATSGDLFEFDSLHASTL